MFFEREETGGPSAVIQCSALDPPSSWALDKEFGTTTDYAKLGKVVTFEDLVNYLKKGEDAKFHWEEHHTSHERLRAKLEKGTKTEG